MKIIVVKKNSEIQEINWKKNVDLQVLYKKCGFRNNTLFEKKHTWYINSEIKYISVYAKNTGRANTENKYELPPPLDKDLYFGSIAIISHNEKEPTIETMKDITESIWKTAYEKLMGGFDDLNDEDSYSEEEYVNPENLTKEGYEKNDFVVGDSEEELMMDSDESEEEEYFSSNSGQEDSDDSFNEEDSDEDDGMTDENDTDDDDDDADDDDDDDLLELANESGDGNELCEEDYEY